MKPTLCICCGEPFEYPVLADAANPNVCASCASLADDLQDNMIIESAIPLEHATAARPSLPAKAPPAKATPPPAAPRRTRSKRA